MEASERSDERTPFHDQTLIDFIGLLGRLFYDDASIVLLDLLAREQKAFLQSDLREKLGWRDNLIQQKLYLLEKHLIVVQDMPAGSRASCWRLNHRLYGAVQWRRQEIVARLAKLVEDASKEHEFECSECDQKFTAIDAASSSRRALDDEHPLCGCGARLKSSEFEETKQQAKEKRAKALQLLQPLTRGLLRISNMDIPIFPQYKKEQISASTQQPVELTPSAASSPSASPASSVISSTAREGSSASRAIPWFDGGEPSSVKISFALKVVGGLDRCLLKPTTSSWETDLEASDATNEASY